MLHLLDGIILSASTIFMASTVVYSVLFKIEQNNDLKKAVLLKQVAFNI